VERAHHTFPDLTISDGGDVGVTGEAGKNGGNGGAGVTEAAGTSPASKRSHNAPTRHGQVT
jgi:hypothetical protein